MWPQRLLAIAAFLAAGLTAPPAHAATLQVPRDHKTIQAALAAARPGDTVLVAAGTYREEVHLKAHITLRSAGNDDKGNLGLKRAEATLIEGGGAKAKGPAVVMAEGSVLDGFTITGAGIFDRKEYDRHHATHGELLPDQRGAAGLDPAPVAVSIPGVTAAVTNNIVRDNGGVGIGCTGAAGKRTAAAVSHNTVCRNMGGGIGIAEGAAPTVERNHCFNNLRAGIGNRKSQALIIDNDCHDNVRAGIGIREGATPLVRGNRCYRNRRAGIGVRMKGTNPLIEDNTCHENEMAGIGSRDGAAPIIRGNRCYKNRMAGIGSRNGARPVIENNDCHENEMAGIGSRDGAAPIIRGNRCYKNKMTGIGSRDGARPIIEGNECYENEMAGIGARGRAVPVIRNNRCYRNEMAGIGSRLGARAVIVDNECFENRMAGIGSREGATAVIHNNRCHKNAMAGIGVRDGARGLIEGNDCRQNQEAGIGAREKALVVLLNNRCIENAKVAIGLRQGSIGYLAGNELARTAGMPPLVAVREGSAALISGNTLRGGGVCGILVEGTVRITDNRMEGNAGKSGSAVWALAKSDVALFGNRVDRYRNLTDNSGCRISVCDNVISNFQGTAITIKKSLAPAQVAGNLGISADAKHRILTLDGPKGASADNIIEEPGKAARSWPGERMWSALRGEGDKPGRESEAAGEVGVQDGPWKLVVVRGKTATYKLFNITEDPRQKKDLSAQLESITFRMRGLLERKEAADFKSRLRRESTGR